MTETIRVTVPHDDSRHAVYEHTYRDGLLVGCKLVAIRPGGLPDFFILEPDDDEPSDWW